MSEEAPPFLDPGGIPDPEGLEENFCRQAAQKDKRYPQEAFLYVASTLRRLLAEREASVAKAGEDSHVTGQQLTLYLRDSLIREFAFLAPEILSAWGITETMDFGNIIYDLVEVGLLSTSENDSRADFLNVFRIPGGLELEQEDTKIRKWPVVRP